MFLARTQIITSKYWACLTLLCAVQVHGAKVTEPQVLKWSWAAEKIADNKRILEFLTEQNLEFAKQLAQTRIIDTAITAHNKGQKGELTKIEAAITAMKGTEAGWFLGGADATNKMWEKIKAEPIYPGGITFDEFANTFATAPKIIANIGTDAIYKGMLTAIKKIDPKYNEGSVSYFEPILRSKDPKTLVQLQTDYKAKNSSLAAFVKAQDAISGIKTLLKNPAPKPEDIFKQMQAISTTFEAALLAIKDYSGTLNEQEQKDLRANAIKTANLEAGPIEERLRARLYSGVAEILAIDNKEKDLKKKIEAVAKKYAELKTLLKPTDFIRLINTPAINLLNDYRDFKLVNGKQALLDLDKNIPNMVKIIKDVISEKTIEAQAAKAETDPEIQNFYTVEQAMLKGEKIVFYNQFITKARENAFQAFTMTLQKLADFATKEPKKFDEIIRHITSTIKLYLLLIQVQDVTEIGELRRAIGSPTGYKEALQQGLVLAILRALDTVPNGSLEKAIKEIFDAEISPELKKLGAVITKTEKPLPTEPVPAVVKFAEALYKITRPAPVKP